MAASPPSGGRIVLGYRTAALVSVTAALVLAALEISAAVVLETALKVPAASPVQSPGHSVSGVRSPYFARVPWGERLWQELERVQVRTRYEPFVMWRTAAVDGETIAIRPDGNRVTPGARCEPGSFRVFVLGGSTAWGYGVPDHETLPAHIQRALAARMDKPVCVINLADVGHASTQSLIQLLRQVGAGHAPDLVVSYQGVNDITVADLYDEAGLHGDMNRFVRRLEESRTSRPWWRKTSLAGLADRLAGDTAQPRSMQRYPHTLGDTSTAIADATAQVFLANHRMGLALAREMGFAFASFWQPNLLVGGKTLTREERLIRDGDRPGQRVTARLVGAVYDRVRAAAAITDRLYYLADAFDDEPRLLYMDWQHVVPEGNAIVARAIADKLVSDGVRE